MTTIPTADGYATIGRVPTSSDHFPHTQLLFASDLERSRRTVHWRLLLRSPERWRTGAA